MFRLGVIEESVDSKTIEFLKPYFYSQRIENVPEDTDPVWHTNEYHIEDADVIKILDTLKDSVKETWYIHAFNDEKLFVVLKSKWFECSLYKDKTWNEMIKYGIKVAKVEKRFLKAIPLHM